MTSTEVNNDLNITTERPPFFAEVDELPPFLKQKYVPSLDGFRAFSIILVLIAHISYNYNNDTLAKYGTFGVNVFFVISGFLITSLLIKEKVTYKSVSLRNFYIRRFLRILPVAYLFLAVLFALNFIFKLNLSAASFLRPLFFVENFGDHSTYTLAGHFWSLSVEEQFYLIFPFLIARSLKNYIITAIALIPGILVITYVYFHLHTQLLLVDFVLNVIYHLLGNGISIILIGSLAAIFLCKYEHLFILKSKYIALFQILLMALSFFFFNHRLFMNINSTISALFIALTIIYTIVNKDGFIFQILNNKYVRYLGTLSYSIYIWQELFTFKQPWANLPYGNSVVLNLILLAVTAVASYHLYEKYFLKLKARFSTVK
ncbi:acyltransferase [uncultured Mucilaginibacter sp.]|uniref:acyltransferase family protein n=1 Tax=uncultured Mucilaginibacter sp. TaxID=797541 RepID=UPI0025FD15C5|nr:acyltransferase [uncultured Mucilaginibacter sp.]